MKRQALVTLFPAVELFEGLTMKQLICVLLDSELLRAVSLLQWASGAAAVGSVTSEIGSSSCAILGGDTPTCATAST